MVGEGFPAYLLRPKLLRIGSDYLRFSAVFLDYTCGTEAFAHKGGFRCTEFRSIASPNQIVNTCFG
jgi:hypothetical protein